MRCQHQKVLITGASAGIGAACARAFAKEGASLLLFARREEKLQAIAAELRQQYQVDVHAVAVDVSDSEALHTAWQQLPLAWQEIDVLINNAGLARGLDKLHEGDWKDWDETIDTNIKGVLRMSQLVLQNMLKRQKGHVINLGSIAGEQVYPGGAVYCATKSALRSITNGLKMDVHGTPIRVTLINPGMVETDFSKYRFRGDEVRAAAVYADVTPLTADDIADVIVFCATRPAHVNIRDVDIYPTCQTAITMIDRKVSAS